MFTIFISQPFTGQEENAFRIAKCVSRDVINCGHIPVSPILMFGEIVDNGSEYYHALSMCSSLIHQSDAVLFVAPDWGEFSPGMRLEKDVAAGLNKVQILTGSPDYQNILQNLRGIIAHHKGALEQNFSYVSCDFKKRISDHIDLENNNI